MVDSLFFASILLSIACVILESNEIDELNDL